MDRASVAETHISVLFFVGDRVYKLRKPVTTAFLDFSTREARRADCLREVALNRRLAPDVYLGVLDLVDGSGTAVDHLVVMRRLPSQRRLSALIEQAGFDPTHLVHVAREVAAFHERAERSPAIDAAGGAEHLAMLWSTNLEEVSAFTGRFVDGEQLDRLRSGAMDYLDGRGDLFARRVDQGRIVDGHGDLLSDDIFCLDDGPRILDCVEFDPLLRWGDVLYDTAFLAMDLERRGYPGLARQFLAAYREFTAESHPTSLEHWYIAYRALVRAKISCLRAAEDIAGAQDEASALLELACGHMDRAQVRLVLVGGLPGTGKTTVAAGLADSLDCVLLRSDSLRKELAGISPDQPAVAAPFEGIYTSASTDRVYAELLRRARVSLTMGESVVLDATWLDPGQREAARALADATRAQLHPLCCTVALHEAEARILARSRAGGGASDATPAVLAALARQNQLPWPGARIIDTGTPPHAALEQALSIVWPGSQRGSTS